MKIRDLKCKSGEAIVSVWPPQWASSYSPGVSSRLAGRVSSNPPNAWVIAEG